MKSRRLALRISTAICAIGTAVLLPAGLAGATTAPKTPPSVLPAGTVLKIGQSLESPNHLYWLVLQGDSNLVLYKLTGTKHPALWNTHTEGSGATWAILQGDGNFVLYTKSGHAKWQSHTARTAGNRLQVQSDGNVVIYTKTNKPTWATHTVQKA